MSTSFSRYLNHGAYSLLNRMSVVAFGFLNVMLMVRMLPKSEIGVWVLFTTVTAFIEMVRAGFIRNPFIIHLVNEKESDDRVITTSVAIHVLLAVVSSALLLIGGAFLASFWKAQGLKNLFYLYALQNLLLIPYFHFEYLQTAKLRFSAIFFCNLLRQGIPCLFILVAYIKGVPFSLIDISLAQIVGVILGSILGYIFIRDTVEFGLSFCKKLFMTLANFGRFTLGTNISSTVLRSTDSWMLGRLASPAAVAVYNPALKLANLFEVPTLAISNFIFPQIAKRMKENGKSGVRDIYLKSVSLILALTIPMMAPLFFFSEFFVTLIFGPAYIDSSGILKVTVLYSLIIPFNRQFGTTMDAIQKPKLNFYLLVIAVMINVVLNYFMLSWFGVIGCAYATLLSYLILFSINQYVLQKHFKVNTLQVFPYMIHWYTTGWNYLFNKLTVQKRIN